MQEIEQLEALIWFLHSSNCRLVGQDITADAFHQIAESMLTPMYAEAEFEWHTNQLAYSTRLLQIWHPPEPADLNFAVSDDAFFGKTGRSLIEFEPNDADRLARFASYKDLIIGLIRYLKPSAGLIDYEMDVVCYNIESGKFAASWGNYLTLSALDRWHPNDVDMLTQQVHDATWIDGLGLLTFIHPLAANQAWTERHIQVQQLFERNPIV